MGQAIDGRIRLLEWLGGSESSGVFLTELPGDRPQKAVIRLIPADATDADAQLARWQAATSLSHPHLMRLLHSGRCQIGASTLLYAVAEYAEENLAQVLPERPLTAAETREMLGPVLDALAYLHGKGLVHGGLKPSNILVVNDHVKLSIEEVQAAGNVNGQARTPGIHDAPECASGTISPAADIWSLGVTLVEALTQRPPVWERGAQNDPVVPESMPQPFAAIVRESLRTDPARRCSLGDVKTHLEGAQSQRNPAGKAVGTGSAKLRGFVLAAAAVILIAVIAIFSMRSRQTPPASPTVEQSSEPPIAAPPAQPPVTKTRSSKGAARKGEVADWSLPDVSPKAIASIHGQFRVQVRVAVDAGGAVSDATLDSPGPSKYFAKAALEAARRWKFKPVQVKGEAVASEWLLQFRFTRAGSEVTPVEVAP